MYSGTPKLIFLKVDIPCCPRGSQVFKKKSLKKYNIYENKTF